MRFVGRSLVGKKGDEEKERGGAGMDRLYVCYLTKGHFGAPPSTRDKRKVAIFLPFSVRASPDDTSQVT